MSMQMLLAVAKPWTYWFAPPLLIAGIALMVALAVGYYRKVMVPTFLWRLEQERRARLPEMTAEVRSLRRAEPASTRPLAA